MVELSKTLMYKFWYDYVKPKCGEKAKLHYMDTDSFIDSFSTPLKNKINHLEKNKTDVNSLKEDHKEFIESNKLILKSQQRLRGEKHNVFH